MRRLHAAWACTAILTGCTFDWDGFYRAADGGPEGDGTSPAGSYVLWPYAVTPDVSSDPNAGPIELGVKFRTDVAGTITAIRFYPGTRDTGTHSAHLWDNRGQRLASAAFTGASSGNWQIATLATPVAVTAGTTYVASYFTDVGYPAHDPQYFARDGVDSGPLHALRDGVDGPNGVFHTGSVGFPTESFESSNYWVDVVFEPAR